MWSALLHLLPATTKCANIYPEPKPFSSVKPAYFDCARAPPEMLLSLHHLKHCSVFSFVFLGPLPAWRNLFSSREGDLSPWKVPARLYWDLPANRKVLASLSIIFSFLYLFVLKSFSFFFSCGTFKIDGGIFFWKIRNIFSFSKNDKNYTKE